MSCRQCDNGIREIRVSDYGIRILVVVGVLAILAFPTYADGGDRDHSRTCEIIEEFHFDHGPVADRTVGLDAIVPEELQDLIRTDRNSLTGVWVADIDLFTNVNPEACEIPKAGDCSGALEGACPEPSVSPSAPMFDCKDIILWTNNTFAIYELTTGSLYGLNMWRIWDRGTYPTVKSLRRARPPALADGYVFQNGVRNKDGSVLMTSSVGEVVLSGQSTGAHPQLADRIIMAGQIYDSNVGRVILSNAVTDTAISLIYAPDSPREAVWMINLRRAPTCVQGNTFADLVFPPRREIRIKDRD